MNSKRIEKVIGVLYLIPIIMTYFDLPAKHTINSLLYISVFCLCCGYRQFRIIAKSRPLFIWLILTLYHWGNGMAHKVPEVDYLDLLHGLRIYSAICIFTYFMVLDFRRTLKALIKISFLWIIIAITCTDMNNELSRLTGRVNATQLGQFTAVLSVYLTYYVFINALSIFKLLFYYIFPTVIIILAQCRNAIGMMAIQFVGYYTAFLNRTKLSAKKIASVVMIGLSLFLLVNFVKNETGLGDRFLNSDDVKTSQLKNGILTNSVWDDILGERLVYYVLGWQLFTEEPVTGIGMWNYKYKVGGEYPLHSEYMVHLCEGGLIGFTLWISFIFSVLMTVRKSSASQRNKIMLYSSLCVFLFCGIYARLFFYEFFYPLIGMCLTLKYNPHILEIKNNYN